MQSKKRCKCYFVWIDIAIKLAILNCSIIRDHVWILTMSKQASHNQTYRDRVFEAIRDEIVSGVHPVGTRLPSLRHLSKRFHASLSPVYKAMLQLEDEGCVERRHGSGVYVRERPAELRMHDSALLCMQATGHVYSDLTGLLHDRLHNLGLFASVLDMGHGDAAELLRQAQYSDARFLIVHGGPHFPYASLEPKSMARKQVIAVLAWECSRFLDQVHRIVIDQLAGARVVAEHLWDSGHRHVLLAGTDNMLARATAWDGQGQCPPQCNVQGAGFISEWNARGGRVTPFECIHERLPQSPFDAERLLAILDADNPPTAVFGLRDVDAWDIREGLRLLRPPAVDRLTLVGDGDTPWSQASHPPFSSLSWNLEEVVDLACGIIRQVEEGRVVDQPMVRQIIPRLLIRPA